MANSTEQQSIVTNEGSITENDKEIVISEIVSHIEEYYDRQQQQQQGNQLTSNDDDTNSSNSLYNRLVSGNMTSSQRVKCVDIITKVIARGAPTITKNALKMSHHKTATPILTTPLPFEDICEFVLEALLEVNNGTFVQEKWLTETNRLLNNKVLSIGVFGRHKAGKSTVLNALLHQEILPCANVEGQNETAALTEIHHNKSKHVSGDKDCLKENCPNCPTLRDISGCCNIRKRLQSLHSDIQKSGNQDAKQCAALTACVPFMSPYSTGDIQVVLMDTPGLSEANELGITDISEHQLMTCSAYIYVISCTQLEDEFDTETLKAIVERDPGVFAQKRMLIAVTKLDEYEEMTGKEISFEEMITSIKTKVQHQFAPIFEVPDECIIPVSAKGALEACKVMHRLNSESIDEIMLKFEKKVGEKITTDLLNEYSQISLLEEGIGDIVLGSYPIWKHTIVRDCSRYLQIAISVLKQLEIVHKNIEKDFTDKSKIITKDMQWKYDDYIDTHRTMADVLMEQTNFLKQLQSCLANLYR